MTWLVPNRKRLIERDDSVSTNYYAYVDTPNFSYSKWKDLCNGPIGTYDQNSGKKVAIIGAGIAGLSAANELLKCGVDVTVYEAGDRIGGRLFSKKFEEGQPELAEFGAMRFPPSEELLFRYFEDFGIEIGSFPDPLSVSTLLSYESDQKEVQAGGELPEEFYTIHNGWNEFLKSGATISIVNNNELETINLDAPDAIGAALQNQANGIVDDLNPIQSWQTYINVFQDKSLFEALRLIFEGANPPGGTSWVFPDDFNKFSSLGAGFGGFGPLYHVSFLEVIRLIVNGMETNQQAVIGGIESVADLIYNESIAMPNGVTTSVAERTKLSTPIYGVYQVVANGNQAVVIPKVDVSSKGAVPVLYDRVLVATTTRAMEIDMQLGMFNEFEIGTNNLLPALSVQTAEAIREISLLNSSKLFIRTPNKFWQSSELPRCILSDSLSANFYTLDYGGEYGVVLMSYVWGDLSDKQIAIKDPVTRYGFLYREIISIYPDYFKYLPLPSEISSEDILSLDWQDQPHFYGGFKWHEPGQDHFVQTTFFHFQDAYHNKDAVYIAGESVSWSGGWIEGALQTAMNASCAILQSLGGTLNSPNYNPVETLNRDTYNYGK